MRNELTRGFGTRWLWAVFLLVGGYALVAGVLVQEVVAPVVSDGVTPDGLIPGLDTVTFHRMAEAMAADIREEGWSAWEWNPGWSANQPVGIMAAVYVITGVSPLYLVPLNAAVHGLSAILLFLILHRCGFRPRECFAGVLPFAFFPSTLTWVAQFHKDGIYCLGLFAMILGCLLILGSIHWKKRVVGVILVFWGGLMVALVRDYSLLVFFVAAGFSGFVYSFFAWRRSAAQRNQAGIVFLLFLGSLLPVLFLAGEKGSEGKGDPLRKDEVILVENSNGRAGPSSDQAELPTDEGPPQTFWVESFWLPDFVDQRVHQLIHNRTIFLWLFPESGSLVDEERPFRNAMEVLSYVPRAMAVGLLAPFPAKWFGEAASPTGGIHRKVSAFEMIFSYACLMSLLACLLFRPQRDRWFVALTAVLMILPLVYAVPAVGSLYRLRFGPYALLLGLGLAFLYQQWTARRLKGDPN